MGARIIYRLDWDRHFPAPSYFTDFPGLTVEAARWLAARRIALLGMDSPGPNADQWAAMHLPLLSAEVVILEGLAHLDQLPAQFFLVAAPLRIRGADGSPVRALGLIT